MSFASGADAFTDVTLEVRGVTEQGDVVCIESDITAVNTRNLTTPDGTTIPATGRSVQLRQLGLP